MMQTKLTRLLERRAYWVAQSHHQRDMVIQQAQQSLIPTLARVDRVRDAVWWLRQRPWLVGAGVATAVALRPSRAWRWFRRGWSLWRLWRRLRPMLAQLDVVHRTS
jgi:hypothetical protein